MKMTLWLTTLLCLALSGAVVANDTATASADAGTVLITGANRGIGLEYARQFEARGYRVIGTARNPDEASELAAVSDRVEQLDVTDPASVAALAEQLKDVPIDILINNAGMLDRSDSSVEKVDFAMMERTFAVNTFGPLRVVQALLPNLRAGERKLIVNMSSQMGSIANSSGGTYAYRASKTALNQLNRGLSIELGGEGFICVVLHPGWVATDMGGASATYTPAQSVTGLIEVIEGLDATDNGRFYDLKGAELPW